MGMSYLQCSTANLINFNHPPAAVVLFTVFIFVLFVVIGFLRARSRQKDRND